MTRGAGAPVYRALLILAPRQLRERHGAEMEALFAERLAAAAKVGAAAIMRTWLCAIGDLLQARVAGWRHRARVVLTVPVDERRTLMFGGDVRSACRSLGRQKTATALVVFMLSLGIAANVAVISLVNGLFLRPFPFPHPERLVYINETAPRWNLDVVGVNYPDFVQNLRRAARHPDPRHRRGHSYGISADGRAPRSHQRRDLPRRGPPSAA